LNLTINKSTASTDTQVACDTYTWPLNSTTYTTSTSTPTVTLINAAGCDSVITLNLTITTIDTSTTTAGFIITSNQTGATYQWIDCNNNNMAIAGETNAGFTASANGDYAVIVTMNGCSDTSSCVSILGIGIDENIFGANLNIYPNPTTGSITIDLGSLKDVQVSITTTTGKEVYTLSNVNQNKLDVSLSDFNKGMYFITVQSKNQQKVIKLIKE
jgi:hypothetical protein